MYYVSWIPDNMRETIGNKWMNPIINHFERYAGKVVLVYKQEEIIDVADGYLEAIALAKGKYLEKKQFISFYLVPTQGFFNAQFKLFQVKTIRENIWIPDSVIFIKDKNDEWQGFDMLIDSGADFCFVNFNFGKNILGFQLAEDEIIRNASGIGGDIKFVYRKMRIQINQIQLEVETAWCLDKTNTDLIIGRKDVFDVFKVVFDQRNTLIEFLPYSESSPI